MNNKFLPRLVAWEVTRQCKLKCKHCRASAESIPYENELSTKECFQLLDNIASFVKPIIILTGGEPMLRKDIFEIAKYGGSLGLRMVIAPCGVLITEESTKLMKESGIKRVSISLDGPTKEDHDSFRGVDGAFEATIKGIEHLKKAGLEFQVNTTITKLNYSKISDILKLAIRLGAVAFHPFLLVPTGRGKELADQAIPPKDYETILNWIYEKQNDLPILFKPTCAPHYHRIMRQRAKENHPAMTHGNVHPSDHPLDSTQGLLNEMTKGCMGGLSFCFISHTGIVQICGFMDVACGDIRKNSFWQIWENAKVFQNIRNTTNYKGKCGYCEYVNICGGCRARAYAITGDYLSEEPSCVYTPKLTGKR
jgi:heme b synthase